MSSLVLKPGDPTPDFDNIVIPLIIYEELMKLVIDRPPQTPLLGMMGAVSV
jgi:hypothetical protein